MVHNSVDCLAARSGSWMVPTMVSLMVPLLGVSWVAEWAAVKGGLLASVTALANAA